MNFIKVLVFLLTAIFTRPSWGDGVKKFVLINGGSSNDSNYSVHETDLQVFNGLFGGNSTILNANGNESFVVPVDAKSGTFQRDFSGWVKLRKTSLNTNQRATKTEFFNVVGNLSAQPPKEVTVVYGDHGTPEGISLWGGDKLNANDIRTAYSKLPDTMIRSIHLHCYGGAAVVDPDRKIPNTANQMTSFLKQNYFKNKCALTLSAETELGQYYSWTDSPRDSSWKKLIEKNKKPSLVSLKQEIAKDASFAPSPLLTSDYLIKDVATAVCKNPSIAPIYKGSIEKCESKSDFTELFALSTPLRSELCTKCISPAVIKLDAAYREIESVYNDLTVVRQDFQFAFLKNKYPTRYRDLEDAYNKFEKELAASIKAGDRQKFRASNAELERLGKDYQDKLMVDFLSVDYREDFENYFDTLDESWVNRNKEKYPNFSRFYLSQPKEASLSKVAWGLPTVLNDLWSKYQSSKPLSLPDSVKVRSARKLNDIIKTGLENIQAARKTAELNRQVACRGVAEPLLKNSQDLEIRKLYESIGECENSNIN
ncbi:MAG: hypothetical protein JNM39_13820 [Bdellovibrionaceae bacterium]|nr:hypothetical protein [Pseudobdellovibrionaceae bacterium]